MKLTEDEELLNLATSLSEENGITIKYCDERVVSVAVINGTPMADTQSTGRNCNRVGFAAYTTVTNLIEYIKKTESKAKENAPKGALE